jgi:dihydrolipoamide dehydrogenase
MGYDVIVIGSGPAGYVAAIRAGQVGLKTLVIEKKDIGGMCLNWGCIPAKAMIESGKLYNRVKNSAEFGVDGIDIKKLSFNWGQAKIRSEKIVKKLTSGIEYIFKKNAIDVIKGEAKILSNKSVSVNNRTVETKYILIATGSYPRKLEHQYEEGLVVELEQFFTQENLPKNVVLYGHGPNTAEIAQFLKYTDHEVTIALNNDKILTDTDEKLNDYLYKKLKAEKINIIRVDEMGEYKDGKLTLGDKKVKCDKIINCSKRGAIIPPSDKEIELDENGFINTDNFLQTNLSNVYAIGDVNGRSYLAHAGSAQGIWVVNHLKGIHKELKLNNYPLNIYTTPEIAQIGQTEQELKEKGINYKVSEFPLSANGKAMTEGNTDGFVRMLSEVKYGQVLGVQIVAENATDMIAEASAFMQIEGTVYDVSQTIHAHPTVSEIFMEAGFDAIDKAIHK